MHQLSAVRGSERLLVRYERRNRLRRLLLQLRLVLLQLGLLVLSQDLLGMRSVHLAVDHDEAKVVIVLEHARVRLKIESADLR